jgi:DnaJ-class molecular chaperone
MAYTFEIVDEEGFEQQYVLPSKFEVCPRCQGSGKHDHPAFANGFSQEDMAEDPDFAEEYRGGRYDVTCERCKGKRVIAVPDEDKCTAVQLSALEQYRETRREMAADDASERRLRMMEMGEY